MRSTIAVYNTALARLGGNQFGRENSPDDNSTEATLCRTLFPHVIELFLAHSEWYFARKTKHLARKAGSGPAHPQYAIRYALPGDCIRPMRLEDPEAPGEEVHFEIDGQDLLTSVAPAALSYVSRVSDPAAWPPAFADAVAWGLAAELSTALVNDVRRQQFYQETARRALEHASAVERNSQHAKRRTSAWLTARR